MTRYYDPNQQRPSSGSGLVLAGLTVIGGLAMGAGVMYLLDPEKGASRRRSMRDTASGALESAEELAASLRGRTGELAGSAGNLIRQSRDMMNKKDEGMCTGEMAAMVVGGAAVAALAYVVTTEFSSIRRGDLKGAARDVHQRASHAASSVRDRASQMAGRAEEYFKDEADSAGA